MLTAVVALAIFLVYTVVDYRVRPPTTPSPEGPVHVHGLGVNPADGALLIATHTGLFRAAEGEEKASRIGDGYQDMMGFTVAGPNYFLGSGHPHVRDLQEGAPPPLGLIESKDAGESWRPISLGGEADFHVLRFAGDRVYGYDATNDRLMISSDRGRTWQQRRVPRPLIDLVSDPDRPGHLLAAGETDLYISTDNGGSWHLTGLPPGLMAWPSKRTLYLVDGAGAVYVSRDAGGSFTPLGEAGGEPSAFLAEGEHELYVALHDGTVKVSTDGGRTWAIRSTA